MRKSFHTDAQHHCFAARTASGAACRSVGQREQRHRRRGLTSLTQPSAKASRAPIRRPVSASPIAAAHRSVGQAVKAPPWQLPRRHFRQSKLRVLIRDDQITCQSQLKATAQRKTVHRSNDRFVQVEARRETANRFPACSATVCRAKLQVVAAQKARSPLPVTIAPLLRVARKHIEDFSELVMRGDAALRTSARFKVIRSEDFRST